MWRTRIMPSLQTATLMAVGDLVAQAGIEGRPFTFKFNQLKSAEESCVDFTRTARFAGLGLVIGGPILRTWYGVLNKHVGSQGKIVAVKKVLIDQLMFAPAFIGLFLTTLGTLEGKNLSDIKTDLNSNYLDIMKTNYCVWPWVLLTNFYLVPLQYQVLFVQTVALFWNTYISWKTHIQKNSEES